MYQVVRAPTKGGAVYTIAPVEDLGKVKCVHRSALKARIRKDGPAPASLDSPVGEEEEIPLEVSLKMLTWRGWSRRLPR